METGSSNNRGSQNGNDVLRVTTTHADTRRFYNRLSRLYDFIAERSEGPIREQGLKLLAARPGEKLLEVGVGTGHGLLSLAKAVGTKGKVYGIDISERMLERSRSRLRQYDLSGRANLICGNVTTLPYATQEIDGVFISFTLELFDTPEIPKVLAECRRVLRPSGRIVVVSLSKQSSSNLPVRIYEWGHRHFPRLLDCRPIYVEKAIRDAGFAIEKVEVAKVAGIPVEIVMGRKQ